MKNKRMSPRLFPVPKSMKEYIKLSRTTPEPLRLSNIINAFSQLTTARTIRASTPIVGTGALKSMQEELNQIEMLRSILLQWQFANGLAVKAYDSQQANSNHEMYKRGQQIAELHKIICALESDVEQSEYRNILDETLTQEFTNLKSIEEDILAISLQISEIEKNAYKSLHRLDLGDEMHVNTDHLQLVLSRVNQWLRRMTEVSSPQGEELEQVSQDLGGMTELILEEREELTKSYLLLVELQKLYDDEKELILENSIPNQSRYSST